MIAQNPKKEKWFRIGEEVLCQDSAREIQYSGKLEPKWKGSYVVLAILLNGIYKIADQGRVFYTPVNGDWLKLYNRWFLESIVIIKEKP